MFESNDRSIEMTHLPSSSGIIKPLIVGSELALPAQKYAAID